jgi:hypothetical protein
MSTVSGAAAATEEQGLKARSEFLFIRAGWRKKL